MPDYIQESWFEALREGQIEAFNKARTEGKVTHLKNANLRGSDLKGANFKGLDLENAYLRYADLRGVDLRGCNLEGVSLKDAKIGGVYFPNNITAEEIRNSIEYGTRLRVSEK